MKTRTILCLIAVALATSIGSTQTQQKSKDNVDANAGGDAGVPGDNRADRVVETIFRQSDIEREAVDKFMIGEVHPAGERFLVRVGNMGKDASLAPVSWDVGRYTGFRPAQGDSLALYQRGPRQSGEGTVVQARGREIGIWIDSDYPRPERGDLLPVCPAYWWWDTSRAPWPFREASRELSFSFDLKAPTAERQGKADVYLCAYFLLRDQRSKRHFWIGPSLFDLRSEDRFPDTVHVDDWEGGTKLPILFTAFNDRSAWIHPGPGSARFTSQTFNDYRRFDFRVGPAELRAAIAAMRKRLPKWADVSDDPRDYQLVHFNVNPEVYAPAGSRGRLGLTLRDVRVQILER